MASMAYSTWNNRPSGENVLTPRSYSERARNIAATGKIYNMHQRDCAMLQLSSYKTHQISKNDFKTRDYLKI